MTEPYLILHKVRGAPAFDIAILCEDMGTDSDPGPWWIIPTSGHRAYPLLNWELDNLRTYHQDMDGVSTMRVVDESGPIEFHPNWDNLPDHCQHSLDLRAFIDQSPIASLDVRLALSALIKPQAPLVRRKL